MVGADARWLAALGATIVHVGSIPASIPYAAAPSHDWANVPVLGELIFHALDALGGDRALIAAQGVAVALTFALLVVDMRAGGASDAGRALVAERHALPVVLDAYERLYVSRDGRG